VRFLSENSQSRFGKQHDHILLKAELRKKTKRVAKKRKKGYGPKSSKVEYEALVGQLTKIKGESDKRTRILDYPRLHFVIQLSDSLGWKPVVESVRKLDLSIVETISDTAIRVSVEKDSYEALLHSLEKNHRYIESMRSIAPFEKIEATLKGEIVENPDKKNWVTIEFSSISGVENADLILEALGRWVEREEHGNLNKSYQSNSTLLLSGFLINRSIEIIVDEVEPLTYVAKIPKMRIKNLGGAHVKLSSVIPLGSVSTNTKPTSLQPVIVIDTGVNGNHNRLRGYIDDMFDFSSMSTTPCNDEIGHGSSVAGLTIYGGDLRMNQRASAKVIMVKNFDQVGDEINHDTLDVIRQSIERYRFSSRILNLSFNGDGPNRSLTRALDEIAYLSDYVIVVSAGNIEMQTIDSYLDSGIRYPDYIHNNIMFFPADCRNVLTVGSHTEHPSNFVAGDCPSPFTTSGFSQRIIKPEVMAHGGNLSHQIISGRNQVLAGNGLGVYSASNIDDQQIEQFGTSFSSPIVANIVAQTIERRLGLSLFLVKALLISSCVPLSNVSCGGRFSEMLQGFGKVNPALAVYSQDWRVCYLMQGEFDNRNPDDFHRYYFLFPDEADQLEVTVACGKMRSYDQESSEYVHLRFARPGVKSQTPLKKGFVVGTRKCNCTYKERIRIERGSIGRWAVDIFPHFSSLPVDQRIKYGIVIAVCSSQFRNLYSSIIKWLEPQKERLLVPTVPETK
jgi:subtilisin family serine protease